MNDRIHCHVAASLTLIAHKIIIIIIFLVGEGREMCHAL